MIEGAVVNAGHAHPEYSIDRRLARSIAKRAAGTLTSQWGSVLAAPALAAARSVGVPQKLVAEAPSGGDSFQAAPEVRWVEASDRPQTGKAATRVSSRGLAVSYVALAVAAMCGDARRRGDKERETALIDVLRMIAAMQKASALPRRWPLED